MPTESPPLSPAAPERKTTWRKAARRARVPLGLLFTLAFLVFARPTWTSMLWGLPLVAVGLWVRALAAGHLRKKQALAVSGPYAYCRNPLYLGSMLMAFGFAVASAQWPLALALAAVFGIVYTATILEEEAFLVGRYPGFEAYARAVPRLVPRLTPARVGEDDGGRFSMPVYVKNREYQALLGCVGVYAFLASRVLFWH